MVSRIRSLTGSSSEVLDLMLALIPQHDPSQKAALGSDLARVVCSCAASAPEYAQSIQEKVATAHSPEVTAALLSALNQVQAAALGAGAGKYAGGESSVATTIGDFTVGFRSCCVVTSITNENVGSSPF